MKGVLDFYGDFPIGGPIAAICGFNRNLGWSTTNNSHDLYEIYQVEADPAQTGPLYSRRNDSSADAIDIHDNYQASVRYAYRNARIFFHSLPAGLPSDREEDLRHLFRP